MKITKSTPVIELQGSVRWPAIRAFLAAGYKTVGELLVAKDSDLLSIKGVGYSSVSDVRRATEGMKQGMKQRSCDTCEWWIRNKGEPMPLGVCRRFPPESNPSKPLGIVGTLENYWCGEWRQKEGNERCEADTLQGLNDKEFLRILGVQDTWKTVRALDLSRKGYTLDQQVAILRIRKNTKRYNEVARIFGAVLLQSDRHREETEETA